MSAAEKRLAARSRRVQSWFDQTANANAAPTFAPEVVEEICDALFETGLSLRQVCQRKLVPNGPSYKTLRVWWAMDDRVRTALEAAQAARAEAEWDELESDAKKVFEAAVVDEGSKTAFESAKEIVKLMAMRRRLNVTKLVPAFREDKRQLASTKEDKSLEKAVQKLERDGKVILHRVVEVPPKETDADKGDIERRSPDGKTPSGD